jgi:predicted DNA-binding helix-hairpin-helix protein
MRIDEAADAAKPSPSGIGRAKPPRFAPAGQSTQIIVGADAATDLAILDASVSLYASYGLRRVYYSAFSPTGHPSAMLPDIATPLVREHRLYQADWLLRYYGFNMSDLGDATHAGMLDLAIDPKLAWALSHRGSFPLDVNTADREQLLRVPGLGVRAVDRILASRRTGKLRYRDVMRLTRGATRMRPFITALDYKPAPGELDDLALRPKLQAQPIQLSLFG